MTGKKRYVTRTVRGEHREAQVALGRLLGEMDEGQHTVQVGTVAELCERWYSNAAPDPAPDRALPLEQRAAASLHAHLDWLIDNERSYRAIIHGASSGDPDVHAIVERVRADVVRRILPRPRRLQAVTDLQDRDARLGWIPRSRIARLAQQQDDLQGSSRAGPPRLGRSDGCRSERGCYTRTMGPLSGDDVATD